MGRAPIAGLLIVLASTALAGVEPAPRPNIVLILADDLGYGDCSAYNPTSRIITPHIDQLAKEGLLFTDAHSPGATCTPSRYGLLTGINPTRTGVLNTLLHRGDPIIAEDEPTIASLLREQGYATKMVGKWHLGFTEDKSGKRPILDLTKPLRGGPVDRGFDTFYGMASSPGASPLCYIRDRTVVALPTEAGTMTKVRGDKKQTLGVRMAPGYKPEHGSPLFCQEAVTIIRQHAAANNPKPLFLYYASPVPHKPWVPSPVFKGKTGLGDYADFVVQLDDVVGQINAALQETGLDQNTILVFTSDNGPGPWAVEAMAPFGHASAAGLRGQKSYSWEGGHRVPCIVKWPGQISPGTRTNALINHTDLFATLSELLQVKSTSPADSVSFLSVLRAPSQPCKRSALMIHRGAVRDGAWKLVSKKRVGKMANVKSSQFSLFYLADDPAEQHDLAAEHPERVQRLFAAFAEYARQRTLK